MGKCKNCGTEHTNGSKFCTKGCRIEWQNKHRTKKPKNLPDRILNNWSRTGEWK